MRARDGIPTNQFHRLEQSLSGDAPYGQDRCVTTLKTALVTGAGAGAGRDETLANLSALPPAAIAAVKAVLAGESLASVASIATVQCSRPHGHVAAATVMARQLGLAGLLGPPCRARQVVMALILARAMAPASKLATIGWWSDTTLGPDLAVSAIHTDEVYSAMDWLLTRKTTSKSGWPNAIWARRGTRRGLRCSTCPLPG
jgi:hypothetical protein